MSNPTTNFNWQMPTSSDLVTDLPADFEVFGQAVDTTFVDLKGGTTGQVLSKASNTDMDFTWVAPTTGDITGVTAGTGISGGGTSGDVTITNSMATAIDAKGDLIAGTGADTFSRLAVGTDGQVLTAASGQATGLQWATPTSSNIEWVLVSTTSTTTGTSYTISSLGSYKKLRIFYNGVSNSTTSGARLRFRMNGDTGSNYNDQIIDFQAAAGGTWVTETRSSETSLELAKQGTASAADTLSGYIFMDGCDGTGDKIGWRMGGSNQASTQARGIMGGFRYDASAGISSLTFYFDTGNFDAGTIAIYGSLN